jgi:hypothetical protein
MLKLKSLVVVMLAGAAISASAGVTYVGSWQVDQGPYWGAVPTAYSGQQAAAFLFGGVASDYYISTLDNLVADIDHEAWVSTWGGNCGSYPCGTKVNESFVNSASGTYLKPGDTSAYVHDWAVGSQFTNYAFKVTAVPEPESYALMLAGLGLMAGVARRPSKKA